MWIVFNNYGIRPTLSMIQCRIHSSLFTEGKLKYGSTPCNIQI